jgi:peptide/nickel transport system substrate-binding protein
MTWEPVSFYPLRALDSASYYAQTLVFEGLVKYDAQLDIVPALAQAFSVSADGLEYMFKIRDGLRFSSGEPLSMQDIIASIKLAASESSPYHADYQDIKQVSAAAGNILTLRLSRPCAPLLSRIVELRILPRRLLVLADHGKSVLSRNPIGCGPFRLRNWESGLELVFTPNPYYWAGRPAVQSLVWRVIPDANLVALALARGEVDVAQIDPRAIRSLKTAVSRAEVVVDEFPGARTIYLGFNLEKSPFTQSLVRQAVCLAIDRKALAEHLYGGYARLAASDFPPSGWAFNWRAPVWPFDRQAAEEMLTQAGFRREGHWWRSPDGSRLAFSILTVKDYQDVAQAICGDLANLGVFTEVHIVEYSTLRQQYLKKGQYQAVVWSRSVGPDPECLLSWHSRGPLNFSRFRDARLDDLLEAGRRTVLKSKRQRAYSKVQEILATQLPWVFLFHPKLIVAHSRRVTHIKEPGQEKTGLPWDNPLFNAARWVKN